MIETIGLLIILGVVAWLVIVWIMRAGTTSRTYGLQREVNLRLTYKRYMQIYPSAHMNYEEYKRLQAAKAYRKAVSSTKIKRMVR